MPKLHVHTKFTLRHDDGTTTDYAPGAHEFDENLVSHWYVRLHTKDPTPMAAGEPTPDDSQALGELEADLVAKEAGLADFETKLKAIAGELEARASELDKCAGALAAREQDLAARIEAFEAAQRAAADQSTEKASGIQSKQASKKS